MNINWSHFYVFLFFYRILFSILGETVVKAFTTLGDSDTFQLGSFDLLAVSLVKFDLVSIPRALGQLVAEFVGAILNIIFLGNDFLINIGFQAIAFVGIVSFLRALDPKVRIWVATLVMMPSFSIWSSIAGKEALVVFGMGVIGAFVIKLLEGRVRMRWYHVVAVGLVFLMKNHYLPAILFVGFCLYLARAVKQKAAAVFAVALGSLGFLYIFREIVSDLSFTVAKNFYVGRSTREVFWITENDVFWKAPEGMFKAFFGPTIQEISTSPLHLASFFESSVILLILILFVVSRYQQIPAFLAIIGAFAIFWIMFGSYPFGVMNPGSAIRYRTGYELFIFLMVFVFFRREAYGPFFQRRKISEPTPSSAV